MKQLPANIQRCVAEDNLELLDGYIRFINSRDIKAFLDILSGKEFWESDVPFAITAFGDIFAWNSDGYIQLYKMTEGTSTIIMHGDKFFIQNTADKEFQKAYFELDMFYAAKERYGNLSPGQCYGFAPIPALGGKKDVASIQIEPSLAYVALLSEVF